MTIAANASPPRDLPGCVYVGIRLQAKWSPTYINTTTEGVWCDPFWAGCWATGDSVFLNELDGTAG